MDSATEPSHRASGAGALVFAVLVGAVLTAAMFAGGASGVGGILPVGGAAVVVLACALAASAFGWFPVPRIGAAGAVLVWSLVLLVAWTGATVAWSIVADRSWDAFNKSLAFGAFLGLGIVLAAVGRGFGARLAASVLSMVVGATLAWALLAKAVPDLDPEGDRVARLREPVGYWNALALLADIALVLGVWLGTAPGHRRIVRVAGGLLIYVATLALMLTLSRAGIVVGLGVLALWFVLSDERVQGGLLLLVSAVPAIAIGSWAFTRGALTEDGATRADRVADGQVFGVLVLLGAAVVAGVVFWATTRSLTDTTRERVARGLVVMAVVWVLAAGAVVSIAAADAVTSERDCSEVDNDPSRLGSLDPNNRLCWWEEAWDVYRQHSPEGAGAGTFEIARKRFRPDVRSVVQPHSVPLQQLADGGVVALGLFVALALAGFSTCVAALRRLAGGERAAALALVAAPAAYLVHSLVDFSWDFLAVTAPTMVALGALTGAGRSSTYVRRPAAVVGVGVLLLAAVVLASFSFPRVADRAERRSTRALASGELENARDLAAWARFFNPVSAEPLFAKARVEERAGNVLRAERAYLRAVELQPGNPETWYTYGIFEFEVRDNMCAAYRALNEAYTRDPSGSQWREGGPLDVARDAVNEGACAPGS
jgi:hypothetical protein